MIAYKAIAYFGLVFLALSTLFYGWYLKRLSIPLKLFFIYLIGLLLSDIISKYLWSQQINNLFILHIFNYFEWGMLTLFYVKFYPEKERKKIGTVALVVLLGLVIGSLFFHKLNEYNVMGFFVLKLFIISMSIREIYYYQFNGGNRSYFINIGLLLSAVVNLAIFSFGNLLSTFNPEIQMGLWVFNGTIFIVSLTLINYELFQLKPWKKNQ